MLVDISPHPPQLMPEGLCPAWTTVPRSRHCTKWVEPDNPEREGQGLQLEWEGRGEKETPIIALLPGSRDGAARPLPSQPHSPACLPACLRGHRRPRYGLPPTQLEGCQTERLSQCLPRSPALGWSCPLQDCASGNLRLGSASTAPGPWGCCWCLSGHSRPLDSLLRFW